MITRDQAYAAYLALGDGRTIKDLREKLIDDGVQAPTYGTLRQWAAAGQWRQRAVEHDSAVVVTVDNIIQQKAQTRVTLHQAAEKAALEGFTSLKRELPNVKIRNAKDAKIMAELTVSLAEAATVMKERGLAGTLPLLDGAYTAARLANGGDDPIAKALEGLFLEPPDGT